MNELHVGDIITTCHKGFWKINQIKKRFLSEAEAKFPYYQGKKPGDEINPLIFYELISSSNGTVPKGKRPVKACDVTYCSKVTEESIEKSRKEDADKWDRIEELVKKAREN